jgi:hypothetical protein
MPRRPEQEEFDGWFIWSVVGGVAVILCCGLIGGLLSAIVPVKRNVVETKVVRTVKQEVIQEAKAPPPPPEPKGCLDGKEGELVAVDTFQQGNGDDKGGWYYKSIASFKTADGLSVACTFDEKLDKVWKPGMKIRTATGERVVGTFEKDWK